MTYHRPTVPTCLALAIVGLMLGPIASAASVAAQDLPQFKPAEPYEQVRRKLLAQGWRPVTTPDADRCAAKDSRCQGRPEMTSCSGTGLAPCLFTWAKDRRVIRVVTELEEGGVFRSLTCARGC
jgi:hypothetical protein